jgi:NAD+ kinase
MKIGIFGKSFSENFHEIIYKIFEKLNKNKVQIFVYKPFLDFITDNLFFVPKISGIFTNKDIKNYEFDVFFSIGGDGTFLECVSLIKKLQIPIIGINSGRLGFLASVSSENIDLALDAIIHKQFSVELRTMLKVEVKSEKKYFSSFPFALNELTVLKKDTSSMIKIEVYLDDEYLNTYWSDGLIVSTPTGSTAYSLSSGGPIILPGSKNFVITPLAPHTLTVRPIVVPDESKLKIIVRGRGEEFLAALDSRNAFINYDTEICVQKADFYLNILKLKNYDYFSTLRKKLMWGLDFRN